MKRRSSMPVSAAKHDKSMTRRNSESHQLQQNRRASTSSQTSSNSSGASSTRGRTSLESKLEEHKKVDVVVAENSLALLGTSNTKQNKDAMSNSSSTSNNEQKQRQVSSNRATPLQDAIKEFTFPLELNNSNNTNTSVNPTSNPYVINPFSSTPSTIPSRNSYQPSTRSNNRASSSKQRHYQRTSHRHHQSDSIPEHTPLNLPNFQSSQSSPLEDLLSSTNSSVFSSDDTVNSTIRTAAELQHLIEAMQIEFARLKNAKLKVEAECDKLQTDYVEMQESLERQFIQVCEERDAVKEKRERELIAYEQMERENGVLKESLRKECLERSYVNDRVVTLEGENEKLKMSLTMSVKVNKVESVGGSSKRESFKKKAVQNASQEYHRSTSTSNTDRSSVCTNSTTNDIVGEFYDSNEEHLDTSTSSVSIHTVDTLDTPTPNESLGTNTTSSPHPSTPKQQQRQRTRSASASGTSSKTKRAAREEASNEVNHVLDKFRVLKGKQKS